MVDENRRYTFAVKQENGRAYVIPSNAFGIPSHTDIDSATTDARLHLEAGNRNPDEGLAFVVLDVTELQKSRIVRTFGKGSGKIE